MALPLPSELSALGAVLCLYRAQQGGELAGWSQAVHACACSGLDSDGLREQILFFDREGRCCWRVCLLPDSDFLAWEEMAARLPAATSAPRPGGIGERLWRGLAGRLQGERWQGSILRLHALAGDAPSGQAGQGGALAASLASLSPLGAATARRIAREEAVDADGIAAVDDCCCERAARAGMAAVHELPAAAGSNVIPLFRFNTGAQA
ncbi:Hemin transport protein [Luteimonas arsenica]|uniref:Hemin transport protein n=1 Tax=Luteimonas arsenica TaxID=1586242 RepID=UPI001FB8273A|nr:Hemin transport protein [Luteimonas arsenica]